MAIFWTVVSLSSLIIVIFRKPAKERDSALSEELYRRQLDREHMAMYERMYQDASRDRQKVVDAAVGMLNLFAPLIPGNADSAVAAYLDDIRTPGAPPGLTVREVDQAIYSPPGNGNLTADGITAVPPREHVNPATLGGGTGEKQ